MKYNIITEIEGVKHYVRRFRVAKYSVVVTMLTTNPLKAFDFKTQELASSRLSRMGIGHAIETNE